MKLALGTVQWGMAYGAFNAGGRTEQDEVAAILERAAAEGIDTLDTARGYGDSEAVLGALGAASRFRIVTKVAALEDAGADGVARSFEASLAALGTDRVDALMLHAADDLLGPDGDAVWLALAAIQAQDGARAIGASLYTPAQAEALLDRYPIGIVQLPMNVFDRRFETSGALARLAAAGVEVHVRSIYLQGFALADPAGLPAGLARYRPLLERFVALASDAGLSRPAAALMPVLNCPAIARAVMGIETIEQLIQLIHAMEEQTAHF